jgi:5-formyltetrahydrofolate cyclo-ligase
MIGKRRPLNNALNPKPSSALRTSLRQQRQKISDQEQQKASHAIMQQLQQLPVYQKAKHIALYAAHEQEIDLIPFLDQSENHSKQYYLPLIDHTLDRLHFLPYQPHITPLKKNSYGIPEPQANTPSQHPPLDLILLPLVAFDRLGHRLGRGKGLYDKTLALFPQPPFLIGLAYAFQELPPFKPDPWDITLGIVLTDIVA